MLPTGMLPIGPLMDEHRLIEKMIALMDAQWKRFKQENKADVNFIGIALDFIRTYADKCHHRKEEDILFRDLDKKPLTSELRKTLQELREEHGQGRKNVIRLADARDKYAAGSLETFTEIMNSIKQLTEFYPRHIEKEDKHFFVPAMQYLNVEEQQKMLLDFWEADRILIHLKYKSVVEDLQKQTPGV